MAAIRELGPIVPVWDRIVLESAYALPVLAGCSLAAAVLGRTRVAAAFGLVLAILLVTVSAGAIIELGPSVRVGAWIGIFAPALALPLSFIGFCKGWFDRV